MNLITGDFETFFSDDYTLSKMTTEEYVRDPRFKTHCFGARFPISHADPKYPTQVYRIPHADHLQNNALLCHHAHFDGLILSHHYDIRPKFWFCTMSMARLLFPHGRHSLAALAERFGLKEKTVPYNLFRGVRDLPPDLYKLVADGCLHDVELTETIFKEMLPHVPKAELQLIDLTIRMFTEPALWLNRDVLTEYLRDTREEKDDLLAQCGITREDCQSSEKFAAILRGLGVEPPLKLSKTTKNPIYAFAKTDAAMKALSEDEDESVAALACARLGIKSNMVETRAQRMLDMDTRGAMCVYLAYAKAHTLRWAGGDKMNWQNLKRGSVLRKALLAPDGTEIVVADASQIECRWLNWLYGQQDILDKFARHEDIYSELATQFYGEPVDKSKPEKRGTGKQIELSCGFRAGGDSIQNTARIGTYGPPVMLTKEQALAARDLYRSTHPLVQAGWKYCDNVILPALHQGNADFTFGPGGVLRVKGKEIWFPGGVRLDYSYLHLGQDEKGRARYYTHGFKGVKNIHGGIVTQNICELLARHTLGTAMIKVATFAKLVTCTHDELVYLVPEGYGAKALAAGLHLLKTPPAWAPGIPLDAEGAYGKQYSK